MFNNVITWYLMIYFVDRDDEWHEMLSDLGMSIDLDKEGLFRWQMQASIINCA